MEETPRVRVIINKVDPDGRCLASTGVSGEDNVFKV